MIVLGLRQGSRGGLVRNLLIAALMFAHVLVPIDLSARGARVLQIVERLPTKRVTLLHVIHQIVRPTSREREKKPL